METAINNIGNNSVEYLNILFWVLVPIFITSLLLLLLKKSGIDLYEIYKNR
jgi:hypothetical protein